MTTDDTEAVQDLEHLEDNLKKVEDLSTRLVSALSSQRGIRPSLQGPSQELYAKAAAAYFNEMMSNPAKLMEQQVGYWSKTLKHYVESQANMASLSAPEDPGPTDRRFADDIWSTHPYFNFIKQQYQMNSAAVEAAVDGIEGLEAQEHKRLKYFSQQIMDLMSPTNFLATNPVALERAVETQGQSLVQGLENLVRDIEANDGDLLVSLADKDAFTVGENLATTEGSVVFRNNLFELIQYAPKTDKVHKIPLVIFPPWINKFYILDMKPKNSFIKWVVEQGYTVFVVSWVNPDPSYSETGIEDYIEDGYLTAMNVAKDICDVSEVNAIGYCIAGTTLSMTLALLQSRKEKLVKSATFFTTMTDFSDQGEFVSFLNDDFVDGIQAEAEEAGMLDSFFMTRTFSFLRSNDLIYGPAIKSYMMGEKPPAFDLLYWNSDSTNLPKKMAVEYLRKLCQGDEFADGGIELFGTTLNIKDVKVPLCAIACETDHIAAWPASYRGVQQMGSRSKTFILSQSGHIAGIVNPPSKNKYGHFTNSDLSGDPDAWRDNADFTEGSWWPRWEGWLSKKSGAKVDARTPGTKDYPALCDAPGTYVLGTRP